jgi:hypothetical protein
LLLQLLILLLQLPVLLLKPPILRLRLLSLISLIDNVTSAGADCRTGSRSDGGTDTRSAREGADDRAHRGAASGANPGSTDRSLLGFVHRAAAQNQEGRYEHGQNQPKISEIPFPAATNEGAFLHVSFSSLLRNHASVLFSRNNPSKRFEPQLISEALHTYALNQSNCRTFFGPRNKTYRNA